jgi:hypothetical protein
MPSSSVRRWLHGLQVMSWPSTRSRSKAYEADGDRGVPVQHSFDDERPVGCAVVVKSDELAIEHEAGRNSRSSGTRSVMFQARRLRTRRPPSVATIARNPSSLSSNAQARRTGSRRDAAASVEAGAAASRRQRLSRVWWAWAKSIVKAGVVARSSTAYTRVAEPLSKSLSPGLSNGVLPRE